MTAFVALYHGKTIGDAELVATTADPEIVGAVIARLLRTHPDDLILSAPREQVAAGLRDLLQLRDAHLSAESDAEWDDQPN